MQAKATTTSFTRGKQLDKVATVKKKRKKRAEALNDYIKKVCQTIYKLFLFCFKLRTAVLNENDSVQFHPSPVWYTQIQ